MEPRPVPRVAPPCWDQPGAASPPARAHLHLNDGATSLFHLFHLFHLFQSQLTELPTQGKEPRWRPLRAGDPLSALLREPSESPQRGPRGLEAAPGGVLTVQVGARPRRVPGAVPGGALTLFFGSFVTLVFRPSSVMARPSNPPSPSFLSW